MAANVRHDSLVHLIAPLPSLIHLRRREIAAIDDDRNRASERLYPLHPSSPPLLLQLALNKTLNLMTKPPPMRSKSPRHAANGECGLRSVQKRFRKLLRSSPTIPPISGRLSVPLQKTRPPAAGNTLSNARDNLIWLRLARLRHGRLGRWVRPGRDLCPGTRGCSGRRPRSRATTQVACHFRRKAD